MNILSAKGYWNILLIFAEDIKSVLRYFLSNSDNFDKCRISVVKVSKLRRRVVLLIRGTVNPSNKTIHFTIKRT